MENSFAPVKLKISEAGKKIISLILDVSPGGNSRSAYRRALEEFFIWREAEISPEFKRGFDKPICQNSAAQSAVLSLPNIPKRALSR